MYFQPSHNTYNTTSQMVLDIPLQKSNIGQQALPYLGTKIWTKISLSTKNVNNKTYFKQYPEKINSKQTV